VILRDLRRGSQEAVSQSELIDLIKVRIHG
jgi:hypothetical protein